MTAPERKLNEWCLLWRVHLNQHLTRHRLGLAIKVQMENHGPGRISHCDFDDPLSFPLAYTADQRFHFTLYKMEWHHIFYINGSQVMWPIDFWDPLWMTVVILSIIRSEISVSNTLLHDQIYYLYLITWVSCVHRATFNRGPKDVNRCQEKASCFLICPKHDPRMLPPLPLFST